MSSSVMMFAAPVCAHCSVLINELEELRAQNAQLLAQLEILQTPTRAAREDENGKKVLADTLAYSPFSRVELERYGRQMLVKEFRVNAQLKLRTARVLVIGLGGLGSPAAMYLAAMGVGTLALVDDDHVDRSNLHRQILHDEQGAEQQEKKVVSAKKRLQEMNPLLRCAVYPMRFTAANALKIVGEFDVVVDASDNAGTRYLVNDACAHLRKPLVSGSALGLEGQVTVFMYQDDENATGCYRCLYPTPPRVAMSCTENGVLGAVPGVIGCLQAMETVKIISGVGEPLVGVQCFYDAFDGQFRRLKIAKKRNRDCPSCGEHSAMAENCDMVPIDTSQLVEGNCTDAEELIDDLDPEFCISAEEFAKVRKAKKNEHNRYVLLDTRARIQFEMVHFPEAVNIPTVELMRRDPAEAIRSLQGSITGITAEQSSSLPAKRTFVICRRGVDSVKVTRWMIDHGISNVFNISGGYTEYAKDDVGFPMY